MCVLGGGKGLDRIEIALATGCGLGTSSGQWSEQK